MRETPGRRGLPVWGREFRKMIDLRGKSVLVAGGAGFVGSAMVRELLDERQRLEEVVDRLLELNVPAVRSEPSASCSTVGDTRKVLALASEVLGFWSAACT